MKIRNRRTGQIVDTIQPLLGGAGMTIAELNEEWEDYEEPKGMLGLLCLERKAADVGKAIFKAYRRGQT